MASKKLSPERLAQIDPLGELQRRAHELWQHAGAPADKTWEDFWDKAEEHLLSAGSPPQCAVSSVASKSGATVVPNRIQALIDDSANIFLSVCASAFRAYLEEHEAICFGHFLRYHIVHLKDERTLAATSIGEQAQLLGQLAGEYPESVLGDGVADYQQLPSVKRSEYWERALKTIRDKDAPLTYADQNTMARLRELLLKEPRVRSITGLEQR